MKNMEYVNKVEWNPLRVIHCDFDQKMINELLAQQLATCQSKIEILTGASKCENSTEYCAVLITFKFKVLNNNELLIGSYISEQWFYLKFPNDNLEELMGSIKSIIDHALIWTRDKFNELKKERKYPFTNWDNLPVDYNSVDAVLSDLRKLL